MNSHIPTSTIPCWSCNTLLPSLSHLIVHLESNSCAQFPTPHRLVQALGEWWYSPLFMDLDIHAQLRTGRVDAREVREWMRTGILMPFVCREEGCGRVFGGLGKLAGHWEDGHCAWGVERVNAPGLEALFRDTCLNQG